MTSGGNQRCSFGSCADLLSSKHKEAEAAQHTSCEILIHCGQDRPRPAGNFSSQPDWKIEPEGGVKSVHDVVAFAREALENQVPREIMEVAVGSPAHHQTILAHKRLDGEIQWEVEDFVASEGFQTAEESEIIFDVFHNVQNQKQIEIRIGFVKDIRRFEMQALICECRQVRWPAAKCRSPTKCSEGADSAGVAGALRRLHTLLHRPYAAKFRFPGGRVDVPVGIFFEMLAIYINIFPHVREPSINDVDHWASTKRL